MMRRIRQTCTRRGGPPWPPVGRAPAIPSGEQYRRQACLRDQLRKIVDGSVAGRRGRDNGGAEPAHVDEMPDAVFLGGPQVGLAVLAEHGPGGVVGDRLPELSPEGYFLLGKPDVVSRDDAGEVGA